MRTKIELTKIIIAALLFALICLCLFGCKSVEKYKASSSFAADCAKEFPVKTDSIYIEGVETVDTVTQVIEITLPADRYTDTAIVTRTVTKTVTIRKVDTVTLTKVNTAAVEACKQEYKKVTGQLLRQLQDQDRAIGELTKKNGNRTTQRNWLAVVVACFVLWNFRHKIIGIFSRLR